MIQFYASFDHILARKDDKTHSLYCRRGDSDIFEISENSTLIRNFQKSSL